MAFVVIPPTRAQFSIAMPICDDYINDLQTVQVRPNATNLPSREDIVDHLWNSILNVYFLQQRPSSHRFDIEHESYIIRNSQKRVNIALINRIGFQPRRYKSLLLEAKTPGPSPNMPPTNPEWTDVRGQLRDYMKIFRLAEGNHYRIYGVTAIGLYARLYRMNRHSNVLVPVPWDPILGFEAHVGNDQF
jgi:hypothetical protein